MWDVGSASARTRRPTGFVSYVAGSDGVLIERVCAIERQKTAIVAAGNSVLTVVWHLLSDPYQHFIDLGSDYYDSRINKRQKNVFAM